MDYKQNMTHEDYMELFKESTVNQLDYLIQDMITYSNKPNVSHETSEAIMTWRYILMQISNKEAVKLI